VQALFGEERATLARQMRTYLNHLDGATRENLTWVAPVLAAEEAVLAARLAGLPDLPAYRPIQVCAHDWEEQPGEPAEDVCSQCGEVR